MAATPDVTDVLLADPVNSRNAYSKLDISTRRVALWQVIIQTDLILIRSKVQGKTRQP